MDRRKVMMQWYSTSDRLPENKQEVLIYCHGQYNVAVYESALAGFLLRGGAFFRISEWPIAWAKLGGPFR